MMKSTQLKTKLTNKYLLVILFLFIGNCILVINLYSLSPFTKLDNSNNCCQNTNGSKASLPDFRYINEPRILSCDDKPPKLLIFVKSASLEFETRQVIRQTWAADARYFNMVVLFAVANPMDEFYNRIIKLESQMYDDILQVDFFEDYDNNTLKTYSIMRWKMLICPNVEFAFVTDSDVIVFTKNLIPLMEKLNGKNNTIIGHCYMNGAPVIRDKNHKSYVADLIWPQDSYPPYCSGTGYLMTGDVPRSLLQCLYPNRDNWKWVQKFKHLDDVIFTGVLSSAAKIKLINTDKIVFSRPSRFDICKPYFIAIHSFKPPSEMRKFWHFFTNNRLYCSENYVNITISKNETLR